MTMKMIDRLRHETETVDLAGSGSRSNQPYTATVLLVGLSDTAKTSAADMALLAITPLGISSALVMLI